jgi:ABC-type transport system involved in multi-copper enzyme maturation permease subunit
MLVIITLLLALALIGVGLYLMIKGKASHTPLTTGIVIFVILIITFASIHFATLSNAIGLEPVYDTALAYTTAAPQDVLIIDVEKIDGKLFPKNAGMNDPWELQRYRAEIKDYNNSLYILRGLHNDIWLFTLVAEPRTSLKPIIIR